MTQVLLTTWCEQRPTPFPGRAPLAPADGHPPGPGGANRMVPSQVADDTDRGIRPPRHRDRRRPPHPTIPVPAARDIEARDSPARADGRTLRGIIDRSRKIPVRPTGRDWPPPTRRARPKAEPAAGVAPTASATALHRHFPHASPPKAPEKNFGPCRASPLARPFRFVYVTKWVASKCGVGKARLRHAPEPPLAKRPAAGRVDMRW
jgi:hypothetical protein